MSKTLDTLADSNPASAFAAVGMPLRAIAIFLAVFGIAAFIVAGCCLTGAHDQAALDIAGWMLGLTGVVTLVLGILTTLLERRFRLNAVAISRAMTNLRIASDGAEIGFWDRDLISGELIWDQTMHRIYGTDPEHSVPSSELWATLVHHEDLKKTAELLDRSIECQEKFETTFRVVTPAGETRALRAAATVIRDNDGRPIRVVGANWDVTELAQATDDLSKTAARLSLSMRSAKIGLWDLDLQTRSVKCDDTFHALFGYETGELNGPDVEWHNLCHPDGEVSMLTQCLAHARNPNTNYQEEYRFLTKLGDWVWVHDAGQVIEWDSAGNPTRMVGVRMLIDESKRTGDALRDVVSIMHTGTDDGVLPEIARSISESFDVKFVGIARYIEDAGESSAELIGGWCDGEPTDTCTYPLTGTPFETVGFNGFCCVSSGVQRLYPENEALKQVGAESYAGVQVLNSQGVPIGVLSIIHDAPLRSDIDYESILRLLSTRVAVEIERNDIEEKLRVAKVQAERASAFKSEFLANVSHEIRTPIAAMIGYADLLLEANRVEEDLIRDYAGTISRNGTQLLTLVNDLLDTSKIEAGQMQMEWIPASPSDLVRDVASLLRPRFEEKGLHFGLVCTSSIPASITTDPARLRQVLINLLGNALKFTTDGEVLLRVSYDQSVHQLRFSVADTGIGISVEKIESLFQPFVQGEASTARQFGGTGLGLNISRRLARLLGGDIEVESSVGVGSTFTASIDAGKDAQETMLTPDEFKELCSRGARQMSSVGPSRPALQGLRVLLVEDSVDNRRLIGFHLSRSGAAVTTAEHGREAINVLSMNARFDLIVTDMQMPFVDGYELVRTLRADGVDTAVVALTAHATSDDEAKCIEAGCDIYATKPVTRERLINACIRARRRANLRSAA